MKRTTGLRFSESLSGYLGSGDDFRKAHRQGRAEGREARFWVTVRIPDMDAFLADPEHVASMSGRVAVSGLGSARVKDGRIHLFCVRGSEKRLLYYLPFEISGERYLLWGEKRLDNPETLNVWRQMTTLYAELVRQEDQESGTAIARGVLRIDPWQVLLQGTSFRPVGTLNPLRAVSDYFRFLRFSSREVRETGR